MRDLFSDRRPARDLAARVARRLSAFFGLLESSRKQSLIAERQIIEASLLFDSNWYLQRYPDIAEAGADPLHHFLTAGWHEGRDPGPAFTTSAYLKANEDVARAGMNPLLHFVQFGLAEGREGFGDRHPRHELNQEVTEFEGAHQCLSFPGSSPTPLTWRRSHRLDRNDPKFVAVGSSGAGYALDGASRAGLESAVEWLRFLSGCRDGDLPSGDPPANESGQRLIDAWYVNIAQLRMRWDGDKFPFAVRAFQLDASGSGELQLVGEAALASSLDFIDLHLLNPYFPLLFVLAAPDGALLGSELLTFPSLCRGGTHYAELLWAAAGRKKASLDVVAASRDLTARLVTLLRRNAEGAVAQIRVEIADSDGSGPLFRRDVRRWLSTVLRIEVSESDQAEQGGAGPSVPRSTASEAEIRRDGGGTLVMPSDTAPTLASLVEPRATPGGQRSARPVPLLASNVDPSKPVISISVPAAAGSALQGLRNSLPWVTPDGSGTVPKAFPAAAIRASTRQALGDAQLLVPVSETWAANAEARAAITWFMQAHEWSDEQLAPSLHSLALQRCGDEDVIALIGGAGGNGQLALSRRYFRGEVSAFNTEAEAIRNVRTPLAGRVAGGVLLHDPRTANCFASMLSDNQITSASCVTVSAEVRSGVVKTRIVDGGAMVGAGGQPTGPFKSAAAAAELWQGSWPVLRPSPYLWVTRAHLLPWSDEAFESDNGGVVHLCTSSVTATWLSKGSAIPRLTDIPQAAETRAEVELLVG